MQVSHRPSELARLTGSWRSGIISVQVSGSERFHCSAHSAKLNIDRTSLIALIVMWTWSRSFLNSHGPSHRTGGSYGPPLTANSYLGFDLFKTPVPQFGGGPDTNVETEACRGFPLRVILRIGLRLSPE